MKMNPNIVQGVTKTSEQNVEKVLRRFMPPMSAISPLANELLLKPIFKKSVTTSKRTPPL